MANLRDETITQCPLCTHHVAQWLLDCKGGHCLSCDMDLFFDKTTTKTPCPGTQYCDCVLPDGHCQYCYKKLVPIGSSRCNGASHNDWPTRKYHKKCWKLKKEDEEEEVDE